MKHKKFTDQQFIEAVKTSVNIAETLIKLSLVPCGANYKMFYKNIKELKIDFSHFLEQSFKKEKLHLNPKKKFKRTLAEILTRDSSIIINFVTKKRLINEKLLESKCSICGIEKWLDKPLTLQIDHINGINNDNRIENLRLLCPNCHSQTDTFTGRNLRGKHYTNKCKTCSILIRSNRIYCSICFKHAQYDEIKHDNLELNQLSPDGKTQIKNFCIDCQIDISYQSNRCRNCHLKQIKTPQKEKIVWPTKEELEKLVWKHSTLQLSKALGVSDKAIEKHCKKLGISKPPRGYWAKIKR